MEEFRTALLYLELAVRLAQEARKLAIQAGDLAKLSQLYTDAISAKEG